MIIYHLEIAHRVLRRRPIEDEGCERSESLQRLRETTTTDPTGDFF